MLFSNSTGHHSYFTKDRMEMTLMTMQQEMKMMRMSPVSMMSTLHSERLSSTITDTD